jgi:hypothetical protein
MKAFGVLLLLDSGELTPFCMSCIASSPYSTLSGVELDVLDPRRADREHPVSRVPPAASDVMASSRNTFPPHLAVGRAVLASFLEAETPAP